LLSPVPFSHLDFTATYATVRFFDPASGIANRDYTNLYIKKRVAQLKAIVTLCMFCSEKFVQAKLNRPISRDTRFWAQCKSGLAAHNIHNEQIQNYKKAQP